MTDLTGRQSKCSTCGKAKPSSHELPFFQYRGPGSADGATLCGLCGFYDTAHPSPRCPTFTPVGQFPYDSHYDGCRGWD